MQTSVHEAGVASATSPQSAYPVRRTVSRQLRCTSRRPRDVNAEEANAKNGFESHQCCAGAALHCARFDQRRDAGRRDPGAGPHRCGPQPVRQGDGRRHETLAPTPLATLSIRIGRTTDRHSPRKVGSQPSSGRRLRQVPAIAGGTARVKYPVPCRETRMPEDQTPESKLFGALSTLTRPTPFPLPLRGY